MNYKKSKILNVKFLTSAAAFILLFALGTGGGVFGIIARSGLHGRHIPESLLWVAAFAWVTSFLLYFTTAFKCSNLQSEGIFMYSVFISIAYIVSAVFYAIFETFPVTLENKGLLVLLLAVGTICAYIALGCWSAVEFRDEKKRNLERKRSSRRKRLRSEKYQEKGAAVFAVEEEKSPAKKVEESTSTTEERPEEEKSSSQTG